MDNALRLFAAGGGFFVVVAGLFLFLSRYKMEPTMVSLRRMGVSSKVCWRETQATMVPMVFAAVLLGTTLSVLLFDRVGSMLLSARMELPVGAVLEDAAAKLAALLLLEGLCAWRLTQIGLMQKRKRGRAA